MKQIGIVVCLISALGGCVSQAPAPAVQPEDTTANQAQGGPAEPQPGKMPPSNALVEQEVHCDVEAKCLAKLSGIASRSGKNLSLKLDNGSTKLFRNTDSCEIVGASCEFMSLLDYRPLQHLFVLSAKYYESYGSLIVSGRTGQVFRVDDAEPHFSPDGKRFVVVAADEQDGEDLVAIFSTSAFPPVQEWSHRPKSLSTMYKFIGWSGNDRVKLRTYERNSDADVSLTSTGWRLTPADD